MLHVRLTQHATDRYCQRVDPTAMPVEVVPGRLICLGRIRSMPRHWMRHVNERHLHAVPALPGGSEPEPAVLQGAA